VQVVPGDYIHADADGVVAVPAGHIDAVLDLAERIEGVEDRIVDLATSGSTLVEARRQLGYHALQSRSSL
jgi:regulator of RNase E activity RraA